MEGRAPSRPRPTPAYAKAPADKLGRPSTATVAPIGIDIGIAGAIDFGIDFASRPSTIDGQSGQSSTPTDRAVFPTLPGMLSRGLPTAWAAPAMSGQLLALGASDLPPVWADAGEDG
jgi:hypothetical protein